ncbi:MAG: LPXTG cell wall anchor domain-containing protein, partial [Planctomycetota bacterium]
LPGLDDDTAFVRIATDNELTNLVYEYTLSRHDFMTNPGTPAAAINSSSDFGWREWNVTIPNTGEYWFAIGIEDGEVNPQGIEYGSRALFDAITTTGGAVVPEPTTWAGLLGLLGTGGLGLFFYRRRRNG